MVSINFLFWFRLLSRNVFLSFILLFLLFSASFLFHLTPEHLVFCHYNVYVSVVIITFIQLQMAFSPLTKWTETKKINIFCVYSPIFPIKKPMLTADFHFMTKRHYLHSIAIRNLRNSRPKCYWRWPLLFLIWNSFFLCSWPLHNLSNRRVARATRVRQGCSQTFFMPDETSTDRSSGHIGHQGTIVHFS